MENFNTHKFLYTLYDSGEVAGNKVEFVDRDNKLKTIVLESIEIGSSPVSCKLYCKDGHKHLVPFIRVKKVFDKEGELIWDNSENDTGNVKVIKGY